MYHIVINEDRTLMSFALFFFLYFVRPICNTIIGISYKFIEQCGSKNIKFLFCTFFRFEFLDVFVHSFMLFFCVIVKF